jgi:hypothetical protein
MSTIEESLGGQESKEGKTERKNNPRATVVERVDTTEPQSKRRTKKIWWFEWKQNNRRRPVPVSWTRGGRGGGRGGGRTVRPSLGRAVYT